MKAISILEMPDGNRLVDTSEHNSIVISPDGTVHPTHEIIVKERGYIVKRNRDNVVLSVDVPYEAYVFADHESIRDKSMGGSPIIVCRAISKDDEHTNGVAIIMGHECCILSDERSMQVEDMIARKRNDKQNEITYSDDTSGVKLPIEMKVILKLVQDDNYRISTRYLYQIGVPKATAKRIIDRMVRDGILQDTGETESRYRIYTGAVDKESLERLLGE